ncbi:hypothetical protein [Rhizobium leguminosarum]|uniref:hypothetical protein n=1 Tax=Rhizobium leguminosarum TaxID=384 RepID=UPI00104041DC|nr:hypothetical protein [Rhizobium leguminosarum]TBY82342.1 hypothetical protein E0H32_13680 [Rhizobium leguminosarum bv. viciae]
MANDRLTDERDHKLLDYVIFAVATIFLAAILFVGIKDETAERNVLYLVVLSLSCAMVFAFLPFDARFAYRSIFRASGTAAIFAFSLYITTHFAEKGYLDAKRNADLQISNLQAIIEGKDTELATLRAAIRESGSQADYTQAKQDAEKKILEQINSTIQSLSDDLAEGIQYSSAARDNSSDSRTCSLRGSQSLAALSRALPRVETVRSSLATLADIGN